MQEINGKKIPIWLVVVLIVGLFGTIIGWTLIRVSNAENRINDMHNTQGTQYAELKSEMTGIRTDIKWIIEALKANKSLILK